MDLKKHAKAWYDLILNEREKMNLSKMEFSALSSWVMDCYQSSDRIYSVLLDKIKTSEPYDFDLLHDCVSEIYFDLKHIEEHIQAAEQGFLRLLEVLGQKADAE